MRLRCIENPSGSNARMGLEIVWEVCQVMSKHILNGKPRLNLKRIQEAQVRTCCRTSESNGCVRVVLGIRVGLMVEWEVHQVMSKHILNGKPRLNLKRIQEAQVRTCCRTRKTVIESQKNTRSTSSNVLSHKWVKQLRSCCIGNRSGFNGRVGLVITWEVCQVMYKYILRGKLQLNPKRIQEAQVRTCCRTNESNGCVRVVLRIRVGLMLDWESRSIGRIQEAQVRTCCRTSESNGCVRVVFGNPKGSNARMGLVIAWEVCQAISEHILNGKPRFNLKRIQEAQVRTCCRTSESNGSVRVVFGIRVGLIVEWES
ncbi:uncharacterized protein G2W53_045015 [Senna tora]|uniref:Uncharacterized protein n=1 Tax=Senna tora TaxID=362788 RepID=A0A834SMQ2_9FABA|nr:uncharacterized protein G2W53_045015 [Senna tora]